MDGEYSKIVSDLLTWLDARLKRGDSERAMNQELRASELFAPDIPDDDRDIYRPFEGYLKELSIKDVEGAPDLFAVRLALGLTCAFDDVVVVYRKGRFCGLVG